MMLMLAMCGPKTVSSCACDDERTSVGGRVASEWLLASFMFDWQAKHISNLIPTLIRLRVGAESCAASDQMRQIRLRAMGRPAKAK